MTDNTTPAAPAVRTEPGSVTMTASTATTAMTPPIDKDEKDDVDGTTDDTDLERPQSAAEARAATVAAEIQQAADEGHDADIPSSIGYVLDGRGEAQRRRSLAGRQADRKESDLEKGEAEAEAEGDAAGDAEADNAGDPDAVWWDGPDDPANPYNWATWRKVVNCVLISMLTFLTPLVSSIFAPGVPELMAEFHSDSKELAAFVVSVYILGFAFGPLIIAPMSEIYGRNIVYHVCNVGFIAFVVGCALAPTLNALIVFRFFSGLFGSCPLTNGGGSIADMVSQEKRGAAMASFAIGPLLGPIVGPVAGGFLATAKGWRWVFWLIVIVAGALSLVLVVCMRETYAPLLLQRKAARLRAATGNPRLHSRLDVGLNAADYFRRSVRRPLRMLVRSPVMLVFALYMAVVYGYLYLMFTSITQVFEQSYGFSTNIVGLVYLGLGIGSMLGMAVFSTLSDRYIQAMAAREGQGLKPEYRLQLLPWGAVLLPVGFFIYGWTAQYHTHWIAPIIGMVVIGFANLVIFMAIQLYLVDAFTVYAASALAANTVIRSIFGAVLPLCGLQMYQALGLGWGNSLLGFIAIGLMPAPFLILRYGEYLRKRYVIKDL